MKVKISRSKSEFEPIRSLLDIAINDFGNYKDEYLKVIVNDAKQLATDREQFIYSVNPRVLKYSTELSRFDKTKLMSFDADKLRKEDYEEILKFFNR